MGWYGRCWGSTNETIPASGMRNVPIEKFLCHQKWQQRIFLVYSYRIAYNIFEVMCCGEAHCKSEYQCRRRNCGKRIPNLQGHAAYYLAGGHGASANPSGNWNSPLTENRSPFPARMPSLTRNTTSAPSASTTASGSAPLSARTSRRKPCLQKIMWSTR